MDNGEHTTLKIANAMFANGISSLIQTSDGWERAGWPDPPYSSNVRRVVVGFSRRLKLTYIVFGSGSTRERRLEIPASTFEQGMREGGDFPWQIGGRFRYEDILLLGRVIQALTASTFRVDIADDKVDSEGRIRIGV